jgi:hypothetical protein
VILANNSQAEVIRALIIHLGQGTIPPTDALADNTVWPAFASNEPDFPDNCLTVFDTPSQYDARLMPTGEQVMHYGFRVRIRSTDHQTGYVKAKAIFQAFCLNVGGKNGHALVTTIPDGNVYAVNCITNPRGPIPQGKDASRTKRSIFVVEGQLVV